jgi:2-keto-4-pentenoate hydratase/2-oxohepta-3-ene-1,7-dioic acid hydratase in catechol pathway
VKVCTYKRLTPVGIIKRLGVLHQDKIVDINLVWQLYFERNGHYNFDERAAYKAPHLLSEYLLAHEAPIDSLKETLSLYESFNKAGDFQLSSGAEIAFAINDQVSLDNPMNKINCYRDFYIHEKHVSKGFEKRKEPVPPAWFEMPVYYKGPTTGFIGHEDEVLWPFYSEKLDYELELAAIISRDGKNIKAKDASKYIFGYSIFNDISARDIQKKEMSVRLGPSKGKDFCAVLGPVITTADEFNFEEPNLNMKAIVNGEEWSNGQSGDGKYSWGEMIEFTSQDEWLRTTDVLGSGTVGTGCGLEIDKWLRPGDEIELIVEKIGSLKNKIGKPN